MEIVSRKRAKELGWSRYYTGRPCKYGHYAERRVKSKGCIECAKEATSNWQKCNPDKHSQKQSNWAKHNAGKVREKNRKWRESNREKAREHAKKHRDNFPSIVKARFRSWLDRNPTKHKARIARRRAQQLKATPEWADLQKIQKIYDACPEGYHVDHIIPLQGSSVCGLHVADNLQHLSASANLIKSNSWG